MAAPTYGTDLTTIDLAESTTGWSAWGGGGAGLSASPDLALEGTNCVDKQITNAEKGQFFDNGTGLSPGTNDHIFVWLFCGTPGLINTKANRGIMAVIGSSTSAYVKFHLTGSDTFDISEIAKCWPVRYVNTSSAGVRTLVGSPGTNPQVVGGGLFTTASVKGANLGVDGLRMGTGYYITAGDGTTPGTFAGCAAIDAASSYGPFQLISGSFQLQGRFVIGQNTSGTPTAARFEDEGALIFFTDTEHSLTDFTQVIIDHASTIVTLDKVAFTGLGTNNPGRFVVNNASSVVTLTSCVFTDIGITTLRAACDFDACSWSGCDQITLNGATVTNGVISGYEGTAGTAAMVWDTNADPDGELDGNTFVKGTAATHAIELGSNTPSEITLRGWEVSGYNASDEQNDSVIYNNSGKAVTINIIGGTGTFSVRNGTSASTTIVTDPVTLTVTAQDAAGTKIQNARCFVLAGNTVGGVPYQDSVTISRSGAVATVTHTAHGFSVGQKVFIRGTGDATYFGSKTIATVPTANSYTYAVTGTPANPTACDATAVIIDELTTAGGVANDTRSYAVDQDIDSGRSWVRKSSAADNPKYKTSPVAGIIDSAAGLSVQVLMIEDE